MYQPRKNEGLERNFRGIRTRFERCYKPGSVLGVFFGIILGYLGSFAAPLFCARNGRFWVVGLQLGLQLGLQTGVTFSEKWGYKSG